MTDRFAADTAHYYCDDDPCRECRSKKDHVHEPDDTVVTTEDVWVCATCRRVFPREVGR